MPLIKSLVNATFKREVFSQDNKIPVLKRERCNPYIKKITLIASCLQNTERDYAASLQIKGRQTLPVRFQI